MKTFDGYIRVSQVRGREGDSFISPELQREQIEAWAKLRGVLIGEWHIDLDETGGALDRPGLNAAMDRIRAGQSQGIAVAKLDRLSRAGVGDALKLVEEMQEAGASLAALDLGIDPQTVFGEFAMTLMLALARMERRRIQATWRDSRQRAVARGVHIASKAPTGYGRDESGRLVPNEYAESIAELFERRAIGASWRDLAQMMNDRGVVSPYENTYWTAGSLSTLIANRAYLGEARHGEFVNHDAHAPLTDRATWERAQSTPQPSATQKPPNLLAGLIRCAGCRFVLKSDSMNDRGQTLRMYRCRGIHSTGRCEDRASILSRIVEPYVEEQFLSMHGGREAESSRDSREVFAAVKALEIAEAELNAYRDDERIIGALGADRFVAGLETRVASVDTARAQLATMQSRDGIGSIPPAAQLREMWPEFDTEQKRRLLTAGVGAIFLRSGRLPVKDRVLILPLGSEPDDLPRRGRRTAVTPFGWPD